MRDATGWAGVWVTEQIDFNPRVPCGTRLLHDHSLLCLLSFQSTRPMRDATSYWRVSRITETISIHASHAGRDCHSCPPFPSVANFNPRVPCGTRRTSYISLVLSFLFQSTRPMRDATNN